MGRGKVDNSANERAAALQAQQIAEQSERTRVAANEATRQSAQQIASAQQRQVVADQISANTLAAKPDEAEVDLVADTETLVKKRGKFQLPGDPSTSIRI